MTYTQVTMTDCEITITLENRPSAANILTVRRGIAAHNIEKLPELLNQPRGDIAAVLRDSNGAIKGGILAEIDWGWMYIDTLWVDESLRRRDYGTRLMHVVEQESVRRGVHQVYLFTTSFQAYPFYRKLGYTSWGQLSDYPPGHTYHALQKTNIAPQPVHDPEIVLVENPDAATAKTIVDGLLNHASEHVPFEDKKIAAFIHTAGESPGQTRLLGGIVGATYWDWLDLRFLWVEESLRGRGYGGLLLRIIEAECTRQGICRARTDTADFQALPFYQKHGYEIFGTLQDRPPGHDSYFLAKIWR